LKDAVCRLLETFWIIPDTTGMTWVIIPSNMTSITTKVIIARSQSGQIE